MIERGDLQQPLTLTVCDYRNGGRSETKILSRDVSTSHKKERGSMESSGKKFNKQSNIKVRVSLRDSWKIIGVDYIIHLSIYSVIQWYINTLLLV